MNNLDNAKQISRLCSFWPHQRVEPETFHAYGEIVRGQNPDDVRKTVDDFIFGKVERNPEFIPPPGAFGAQMIRVRNERLDREARDRPRIAAPEPKRDTTPEDRKAMVQRMRESGLLRMKNNSAEYMSAADHEAAKAKAIKEALSLEADKLIIAAANGDEAALAEYQRDRPVVKLSDASLAAFGMSRKERELA